MPNPSPYIKNLDSVLNYDVQVGKYTPDLARLRYKGAIKVFLWDDLQDFDNLCTALSMDHKEVENGTDQVFMNARTKNSYLPWYNIGDSDDEAQAYCLEEADDLLVVEVEDHYMGTPLPVRGRLFTCDLEILCGLDEVYRNGKGFDRFTVDVLCFPNGHTPQKAFTWMNQTDHLFQRGSKLHHARPGFDFTPFPEIGAGASKHYHFFGSETAKTS